MTRSIRFGVIASVMGLAGAVGLKFALAAPPQGSATPVEFTPDGKMKRPEGYREWIYMGYGNDSRQNGPLALSPPTPRW